MAAFKASRSVWLAIRAMVSTSFPTSRDPCSNVPAARETWSRWATRLTRSEEHTSELQSQSNLVCRLLLEKKKNTDITYPQPATSCEDCGSIQVIHALSYH